MARLSIRDLQKISGETIGALPGPTPVKSGERTIGLLAGLITVVPVAALEPMLTPSEAMLRDAVASRNGSTRDAHVLAHAQSVEGDIWSPDRDYAGTGVPTWSTPNLMRAYGDEA